MEVGWPQAASRASSITVGCQESTLAKADGDQGCPGVGPHSCLPSLQQLEAEVAPSIG